MDNRQKELDQVKANLDARGALSPESINSTALDAIYRAFCTIRACAHDDPRRAGIIADSFHNLPRVLQGGDHEACREETVRAIRALTAQEQEASQE